MIRYLATVAAIASLTAPASAAPAYLTCSIPRDGADDAILSVAVLEDQQIVTFHYSNAELFIRADALFSPTHVRWNHSPASSWRSIYILDRSTLSLALVEQIGGNITTKVGSCTITSTAKRAF